MSLKAYIWRYIDHIEEHPFDYKLQKEDLDTSYQTGLNAVKWGLVLLFYLNLQHEKLIPTKIYTMMQKRCTKVDSRARHGARLTLQTVATNTKQNFKS